VTLAIDDFGTGYSSLASLRRLTIDRIKIDRSFVTELATNGGDLNIVRSIIDLGRNLGPSTIAEGVESREVLDIVRALGCDEYQGFLVSAPLCASAVTELMENRRAVRVPLRIVR
jgi:EAL domain-containing protein (putative c-di-GMP-specific phosphodiesterase class I)